MHDRTGMDHHVDPAGIHSEKPARLDHLEALVHQRGRVDGHFGSHAPARVSQRLGDRHVAELVGRAVQKRSARCGQDHFLDFRPLAAQALENGRVLRIHRDDRSPVALRQLGNQLSGHDQTLLVRQRDLFAPA